MEAVRGKGSKHALSFLCRVEMRGEEPMKIV